MLGAVMATIDQRHPQIHRLIQLAVERAPHAGIETKEVPQHRWPMRQRLLDAPGLAFQHAVVNFFDFWGSLFRFNQRNASHQESPPSHTYNKHWENSLRRVHIIGAGLAGSEA